MNNSEPDGKDCSGAKDIDNGNQFRLQHQMKNQTITTAWKAYELAGFHPKWNETGKAVAVQTLGWLMLHYS